MSDDSVDKSACRLKDITSQNTIIYKGFDQMQVYAPKMSDCGCNTDGTLFCTLMQQTT